MPVKVNIFDLHKKHGWVYVFTSLLLLLISIQFEDVEQTGLNVEIAWTYYIHNRCCLSKIFDNIANLTILMNSMALVDFEGHRQVLKKMKKRLY